VLIVATVPALKIVVCFGLTKDLELRNCWVKNGLSFDKFGFGSYSSGPKNKREIAIRVQKINEKLRLGSKKQRKIATRVQKSLGITH
jgi:hypothetical protein